MKCPAGVDIKLGVPCPKCGAGDSELCRGMKMRDYEWPNAQATGMTMRQYYKAMVMRSCPENLYETLRCARWAGRMADAMLKEDSEHSRVLSQSEIEEE